MIKELPTLSELEAHLASETIDDKALYLERGRVHKALTDQHLTERMLRAVQLVADNPQRPELVDFLKDLVFEFEIRGKEPPAEFWQWLHKWQAAIRARGEAFLKEDREGYLEHYEKFASDLLARVETFKKARDKAN